MHQLRIRFHDPAEIFGEELAAARKRGDISAAVTANVGMGPEPPRDEQGRPLGSRLIHLGRDTAFGLVLRSNFFLGWGIDDPDIPEQAGLNLIEHSHAEWLYLARFLPALYIAERRGVDPAPSAW